MPGNRKHAGWLLATARAVCDAADVAGPDDPQLPPGNVGQSTSRRGEDITTRHGEEAGRQVTGPPGRQPSPLWAVRGAGRDRRQPAGATEL
jgi:hypothetical protein